MKELNAIESKSTASGAAERVALVKWQQAFTFDKSVTPNRVFSLLAPKVPIAFVRVRELFPDEVNSLDMEVPQGNMPMTGPDGETGVAESVAGPRSARQDRPDGDDDPHGGGGGQPGSPQRF